MRTSEPRRTVLRGLGAALGLAFGGIGETVSAAGPSSTADFLAGGDVSALGWLERRGARYYDRAGRRGDALAILRDAGFKIVRLRLYEQPGAGRGHDGWHWPADCMNLPDLLALARRSAALGMQIQLTFHYSDFWTNGKMQAVPKAWQAELDALPDELARFARLRRLVHARTREVMLALQAQGTTPQFVSIGNEIEGGLLYPYGATEENWPRLGALLQAGYDAVKSVAPGSRVILHLDDGGNLDKYTWYFDHLRALGVQWDVTGASYYPFWTKRTVGELAAFIRAVTARYDKDLFVMEAGFNWAPRRPDGHPGQLADNGPYPAAMSSPEGQRRFMDELLTTLRRTPRALGVLYWDPVMIETPGVGWALRDTDGKPGPNVVSNTTLFDFGGRALPALDSFGAAK
jgi:arabinogalactan endo-1,4-beta-galactosidase